MRVLFLVIACLAACAPRVPESPVLSNRRNETETPPSLEGNLAATMVVRYVWRNHISLTSYDDVVYGVVLDDHHVLTEAPSDTQSLFGWRTGYLESVSIEPYAAGDNGVRDRWSAKIVARYLDLAVLKTRKAIQVAPVKPAWRIPQIADAVYYVSDDHAYTQLQAHEGRIFAVSDAFDRTPGSPHHGDFLVGSRVRHLRRGAVFNMRHEFVGFPIYQWSIILQRNPLATRAPFMFALTAARGRLKSMLRDAHIRGYGGYD